MQGKQIRLLLIFLLLAAVSWSYASYQYQKSSRSMASAAHQFLVSLSPEQKAKATFAFQDDQRMTWHFIPDSMFPRKGIAFKDLDPAQRKLAHALLSTGLSQRGYQKAATIMSLEAILKDIEQGKGPVRDPDLYFFSVFGEPSESQTWGWRVEGHHLSLNYTLVGGQQIACVPSFMGSNPAEVKQGPRQGLRVLAREEDLGRELVKSLDKKQMSIAVINQEAPKDILTSNLRKAEPGNPQGLAVGKMTKREADLLMELVEEYAQNLPGDLSAPEMEKIRKAGIAKIHFAWEGGLEAGQGHYYRIQGPTFLIELDNTQNNANHIHSVWRGLEQDWGLDLLKQHYAESHSATPEKKP
ncbi:MAG: DUF3500 domain-containing protein [Terriglobia bacterium]